MAKLRVNCFAVSLDGFGAGPNQDLNNPLGVGGKDLHQWFYPTRVFQKKLGKGDGETGVDNDFAEEGISRVGAWILGRNMFGPIRGAWPDDKWKGWWGDTPPYHTPAFVLTHHPRAPLVMAGGTTFYFVTDGFEAALRQAKEAAGELDVRIGGGPATIRQYLRAGLVDHIHLAFSPVLLGSGESLLAGINLLELGYRISKHVTTPTALHVVFTKENGK